MVTALLSSGFNIQAALIAGLFSWLAGIPSHRPAAGRRVVGASPWVEKPIPLRRVPPSHENDWLSRPDRQIVRGPGDDTKLEHNSCDRADSERPGEKGPLISRLQNACTSGLTDTPILARGGPPHFGRSHRRAQHRVQKRPQRVGPERAGELGFGAEVEVTGARTAVGHRSRMPDLLLPVTELNENRLTTEPPGEVWAAPGSWSLAPAASRLVALAQRAVNWPGLRGPGRG